MLRENSRDPGLLTLLSFTDRGAVIPPLGLFTARHSGGALGIEL